MGVLRKSLPLYRGMALRCIALTFCMSIMAAPARSETVPILPAPATVAPTAGQLEYYGTTSGYLCKYPYAPTGADQSAVALATAKLIHANGEAIYTGSGIYDGKHYSWYQTHLALPYYPLVMVVTQYICRVGSEGSPSYNCGPIPNSRNNPNECCACGYRYDSGQSMCVVNPSKIAACAAQCPAVAAGETPFTLDPGGLTCSRPDQCPVDPLPELPKDDLCAQSLNRGLGVDVDDKCPKLDARLTGADGQLQCFANKIAATNVSAWSKIPYDGPTATIRNTAYQKHLQDIWDKMIELNKPDNENNDACQPLRDKVAAEKGCDSSNRCLTGTPRCMAGSHCIDYRPADYSNHPNGMAFDVPNSTINGLIRELTPLPPAPMTAIQQQQAQRFWISNWLAKPTACNLVWGGGFTNPDVIHFQLR